MSQHRSCLKRSCLKCSCAIGPIESIVAGAKGFKELVNLRVTTASCETFAFDGAFGPDLLFHSFTKRLQHQGKSSGCSCCFLCVQLGSTCDGIRSCVFCLVDIERRHSRHCAAVRIAVSSMHFWLLWFLVSHVFS